MANIWTRARRYEQLTPGERAALRLIEGLIYVALVGAATAGAQYLASPAGSGLGAIDWATVARVCIAGAAVALLMALAKYFKAHGDPALGDALGALSAQIASPSPLANAPKPTLRGDSGG
jgi:hypothetical protein